jgi:hypothetical protein
VVVLHHPADAELSDLHPMRLAAEGTLESLRRIRGAIHATDAVHVTAGGAKTMTALWTDSLTQRQLALGLPPPSVLPPNELQAAADAFLTTADAALLASTGSLLMRNGSLVATSWKVLFDGYGAEAMLRLRSALEVAGVSPSAFAFSANDIYYEQDAGLLAYTRQSLYVVCGAVLGAVWLLTLSGGFVCLMGACTLSCVSHLVGWMVLVDIKLRCVDGLPVSFPAPRDRIGQSSISRPPPAEDPRVLGLLTYLLTCFLLTRLSRRSAALAQLHLDGAAAPLSRPLHRLLHAHCPRVLRGARHRARARAHGAAHTRLGCSQRGRLLGSLGAAAGLWPVGHLHHILLVRSHSRRARISIPCSPSVERASSSFPQAAPRRRGRRPVPRPCRAASLPQPAPCVSAQIRRRSQPRCASGHRLLAAARDE